MARKQHPDSVLLALILILIFWGSFALATISFPFSLEKYGKSWYYFLHQLLLGLLPGILIVLVLLKLNLKILKKLSPYILGLNLFLLILVFLPGMGVEIKGAKRWLNLGLILFQPSEILKVSFLLYLSAWLSSKLSFRKKIRTLISARKTGRKNWQAPLVFITVSIILITILILQPDFSTLSIIFLTGLCLYFISYTPWWHSVILILASGGLGVILIKIAPYRLARVLAFFNTQIDPLGISYQLKQALIAIGSGKFFGVGGGFNLGLSRQKFGFLPQPMTDSIFAIIGEEMGLLGCSALILLFLLFAWRGFKIALDSKNEFSRLLAAGITFWITLQAFFNIGGITGILPLAGIPLPFFSYGASHLITEMIGVGILLNISKNS